MIFGISSAFLAPQCGHLSRSGANRVPHEPHSASTPAAYVWVSRTTTGLTDWPAAVVVAD